MYPIGVVGPGSERLVERLAEFLARDGRVNVIVSRQHDHDEGAATDGGAAVTEKRDGLERYRTAGATSVYGLDDGTWRGVGDGIDLREALYAVAPTCEFCVVEGAVGMDVPTIVIDPDPAADDGPTGDAGDEAAAGPVLATATEPEAVDLDAVREALETTEPVETLESLVERVKRSPQAPESGAIATFTGRVRAREDGDDTATEYLEFEKYEGVADERMAELSAELEERDGVHEVLMHHRSGRLDYGEDIVFVVVLAGHRGEAFRTVEDGIDRLKAEVPIFKKEVTVDEEFWVHDRP